MNYTIDVIDNAFEFLRYNHKDIKEAIAEDISFLDDIQNGSIRDRFTEDLHSRNYTWMEAALIIENCKNEEEDASLWFGRKMEEMVTICATYSFANDVWEMAKELYSDLLEKYEVKFEVVTQHGEVISDEFEDEFDAEDFIEEHVKTEANKANLSIKETSNLEEIWAEFLKEYTYVPDISECIEGSRGKVIE